MRQTDFSKFFVIFRGRWTFFYFACLFGILVLLPNSVEATQLIIGQENFKNDFSFFVGDADVLTPFTKSLKKRFNVSSDMEYFIDKSGSEHGGSLIKLLLVKQFDIVFMGFLDQFNSYFIGEVCAQESPAEPSENSGNSSDKSNCRSGHDEISFQWIVGYIILLMILMVFSWWLGLKAFSLYIQRLN